MPCFWCGGHGAVWPGGDRCECCEGSGKHNVEDLAELPPDCRAARAEMAAAGEL